jgi:phosphosulfolactate synthase
MTKAWEEVFGDLNRHKRKPRSTGITMVLDKCQGLRETADMLNLTSDYIDHWKLSFGTSALLGDDNLRDKIAILKQRDMLVYPGGTLAEYAIVQGVCRKYMRHALSLGFNGIEISDGTIHLSSAARHDAIRYAADLGLAVIAEVGKKDTSRQPTAVEMAELALADFESGAKWVIIEARESGLGIGVFADDGTVHEDDVETIADILSDHLDRLVWETPLKKQQEYFILRFGPDVCLGNIKPRDVLGLEAMRIGLRFETFRKAVQALEVDD